MQRGQLQEPLEDTLSEAALEDNTKLSVPLLLLFFLFLPFLNSDFFLYFPRLHFLLLLPSSLLHLTSSLSSLLLSSPSTVPSLLCGEGKHSLPTSSLSTPPSPSPSLLVPYEDDFGGRWREYHAKMPQRLRINVYGKKGMSPPPSPPPPTPPHFHLRSTSTSSFPPSFPSFCLLLCRLPRSHYPIFSVSPTLYFCSSLHSSILLFLFPLLLHHLLLLLLLFPSFFLLLPPSLGCGDAIDFTKFILKTGAKVESDKPKKFDDHVYPSSSSSFSSSIPFSSTLPPPSPSFLYEPSLFPPPLHFPSSSSLLLHPPPSSSPPLPLRYCHRLILFLM